MSVKFRSLLYYCLCVSSVPVTVSLMSCVSVLKGMLKSGDDSKCLGIDTDNPAVKDSTTAANCILVTLMDAASGGVSSFDDFLISMALKQDSSLDSLCCFVFTLFKQKVLIVIELLECLISVTKTNPKVYNQRHNGLCLRTEDTTMIKVYSNISILC